MEVYRAESREILRRFVQRKIDERQCVSGLDAALAGVIPTLKPSDIPTLREIMRANHEEFQLELERRKAGDRRERIVTTAVQGFPTPLTRLPS
jgi:hypothetical protein